MTGSTTDEQGAFPFTSQRSLNDPETPNASRGVRHTAPYPTRRPVTACCDQLRVPCAQARAHGVSEWLRLTGVCEASSEPCVVKQPEFWVISAGTRRAFAGDAVAALTV
jgi:hypothetical protein